MWVEPEPEHRDAAAVACRLSGRPGLCWLDGQGASARGRYSFVSADPEEIRTAAFGDPNALSVLGPEALLHGTSPGLGSDEPGPRGGPPIARVPSWVGFVAYDAALSAAAAGPMKRARADHPVVWWGRYPAMWVLDRATGEAFLAGDDAEACRALRARIASGRPDAPQGRAGAVHAEDPAVHARAIDAALAHIGRGDIYQVNLARRWWATYAGAPLALFLAMRRESAVPLGFYLETSGRAVLGRSMESFLAFEGPGGALASSPIKGTVARPDAHRQGPGSLTALAEGLRADEKERAEHAMIVDLVRNDLGRVAAIGTVEVADLFRVEPYARLAHLVSTVRCRTLSSVGLPEVLAATFPPGSVTGAPKVRAVQVIEDLERAARGVYCGAVGYVARTGGAHLAVAIRTAQVLDGSVEYHAGGGLVEASVPAREIAETELKARVFLDALKRLGPP